MISMIHTNAQGVVYLEWAEQKNGHFMKETTDINKLLLSEKKNTGK